MGDQAKADELQNRLEEFAARIIKLADNLPGSKAGQHIAGQVLRSGTSPAPNYGEARGAESRADFKHKLGIVQKELNETVIWLRVIRLTGLIKTTRITDLHEEATQLARIREDRQNQSPPIQNGRWKTATGKWKMKKLPHIPILRLGKPYVSLDTKLVTPLGKDEPLVEMSVANAGIIKRDAKRFREARDILRGYATDDLIDICFKAGELFMTAELPFGDTTQTAEQYVDNLSMTSGLPHTLVRANMAKVNEVFTEMPIILKGLTRGLDLKVLDEGFGEHDGVPVSYFPTTTALGVVLPSNSPGVNSLWMPAFPLKIPVILKPGSEEPWTPYRVIQAFIAAGAPPEAFGFYPTDHEGSNAVTDVCDRSIIFGGQATVEKHAGNPKVEVHGPGWSKVLIGEDKIDNWREYIDVLVKSIAANSGRSCINASAIVVPRHGKEIADALAERLVEIQPQPRDAEGAMLSGIANPAMAAWASEQINDGLEAPGAEDVTTAKRGGAERVTEVDGVTYALPTLIRCDSWDHPLANKEFMFPFASVVEVPQDDMLDKIGQSLVVTAITEDPGFITDLLCSPLIQRLNLGPMPTSVAKWDQPHEGNLFEFLYHRRAIQRAMA